MDLLNCSYFRKYRLGFYEKRLNQITLARQLHSRPHCEEAKTNTHYDAKDTAGGENVVGREIRRMLPNCLPPSDTMHTLQIAMKHSMAGDSEIALLSGVYLTNKKTHEEHRSAIQGFAAVERAVQL